MESDDNTRSLPAGWTFFRQWLKNPLRVAAISPSSRQLARQMMTQLPRNCRRVIELGGGTGVFTQALIDHGIVSSDLLVLELNEELHQHLVRQFPQAKVVCGDAGNLREIANEQGFHGEQGADAIARQELETKEADGALFGQMRCRRAPRGRRSVGSSRWSRCRSRAPGHARLAEPTPRCPRPRL